MNREANGDPWYKATYALKWAGKELQFDVPHDVFSTLRIDEGTLLLLDHLPQAEPSAILDMGCGYGALGVPVAARYPNAKLIMVDRDLLAVEWANANVRRNKISNAIAQGSLGFRDVKQVGFDWILCNVPARIGKEFIAHLFTEGKKILNPGGEIRVVVIRDLVPTLNEIGADLGIQIHKVAEGQRHSVLSWSPSAMDGVELKSDQRDLYLRDTVQMEGVTFERPFDLGGDDPKRLRSSLPLLLDALPRERPPVRVLCVRGGYGVLPILCGKRWPNAQVFVFDRDLLAHEFTSRNVRRHLDETRVIQREGYSFPAGLRGESCFDLILLEISSSAGQQVAEMELSGLRDCLSREGLALIVCLDKIGRDWVRPTSGSLGCSIRPLAARDGFTVFSLVRID